MGRAAPACDRRLAARLISVSSRPPRPAWPPREAACPSSARPRPAASSRRRGFTGQSRDRTGGIDGNQAARIAHGDVAGRRTRGEPFRGVRRDGLAARLPSACGAAACGLRDFGCPAPAVPLPRHLRTRRAAPGRASSTRADRTTIHVTAPIIAAAIAPMITVAVRNRLVVTPRAAGRSNGNTLEARRTRQRAARPAWPARRRG